MNRIFKWFIIFAVALIVLLMSPFVRPTGQERVLSSIGDYTEQCFYSHGGLQDYTDFGIYSYSNATPEQSQYFASVSDSDADTISSYIDDFEEWVSVFKNNDPNDVLVRNYAFDCSIIDTSDYFYIDGDFSNYDVWFFDTQTNRLYYFHNNT